MEYKELEILWKQYDEKLNNLEKINKKLLRNTLLQRPQKKLDWMKFQSLYRVIAMPIILLVVLPLNFKVENIDWIFILGCILISIVVLYVCTKSLRYYLIFKKIDLSSDSVIQSLSKITMLKKLSNNDSKYVFLYWPVISLGVILMGWHSFVFTTHTILFLSTLFIVGYFVNIWDVRIDKERINKFEKVIIELKEYTEE